MTTTMRDRFNEMFWKGKDETAFWKYEKSHKRHLDFIEQELKKEREEIVEIVNKKRIKNTEKTSSGYVYKSSEVEQNCKDIINTIKNRV